MNIVIKDYQETLINILANFSVDRCLDFIYHVVDIQLRYKDYHHVILFGLSIEKLKVEELIISDSDKSDLLLGFLTATLPEKSKLKRIRARIIRNLSQKLPKEVLRGLE